MIINILLVIAIGFLLYYIMPKNKTINKLINDSNKYDNFTPNSNNDYIEEADNDEYISKLVRQSPIKSELAKNPIFVDNKFHNDFRDTITAFEHITPNKQIFNMGNIPIRFNNPPKEEVSIIINDFIKEVNKYVNQQIGEYYDIGSGWNDHTPEKRNKHGWEKHRESLGLPAYMYPDPAKRAPIILIAVDNVEKQFTDDETKYIITLIIGKKQVIDQMIVKISFVINKREVNHDREFFETIKDTKKKYNTAIIEEINIIGFLQREGLRNESKNNSDDDYYNFNSLNKQDITDNNTIMKELLNKSKVRKYESSKFNGSINGINPSLRNIDTPMDAEHTEFRQQVPHERNYDSYQVTQTIDNDFNNKKKFI